MMTASNLDEVRKAAADVQQVTGTWQESELTHEPAIEVLQAWKNGLQRLAAYALSTIPANPMAPITAEWLREVWGFTKAEWSRRDVLENGHAEMTPMKGFWLYEDDNLAWPHSLTTRHQFTQLAAALGLQPKGDV